MLQAYLALKAVNKQLLGLVSSTQALPSRDVGKSQVSS
jgi:hypothetical protein